MGCIVEARASWLSAELQCTVWFSAWLKQMVGAHLEKIQTIYNL